jgi:hypothetical protein
VADLDLPGTILDDSRFIPSSAVGAGNKALVDKVTGQPVLLAKGPTGGKRRRKKPKAKKSPPTLADRVKKIAREVRPLFRSSIKDEIGLNVNRAVGRKVKISVVTVKEAQKLGLALHKSLLRDEWDIWLVMFKRDPQWVIDELKKKAGVPELKDELDKITKLTSKWKYLVQPFGADYYAKLWEKDLASSKGTGNTAAFYWPSQDKIYLLKEANEKDTDSELALTIAHELAHAYAKNLPLKNWQFNDWRRFLDFMHVVGKVSWQDRRSFNEAITQYAGFKAYEAWFAKYAIDGQRGAKEKNQYGSRADLELVWEDFERAVGVDGVLEAFYEGSVEWKLTNPLDNITVGRNKKPYKWPTGLR